MGCGASKAAAGDATEKAVSSGEGVGNAAAPGVDACGIDVSKTQVSAAAASGAALARCACAPPGHAALLRCRAGAPVRGLHLPGAVSAYYVKQPAIRTPLPPRDTAKPAALIVQDRPSATSEVPGGAAAKDDEHVSLAEGAAAAQEGWQGRVAELQVWT